VAQSSKLALYVALATALEDFCWLRRARPEYDVALNGLRADYGL